jgi:hypothetical protein
MLVRPLARPDHRRQAASRRQRRSRARRRQGWRCCGPRRAEFELIEPLQLAGRADGLSESAMHR